MIHTNLSTSQSSNVKDAITNFPKEYPFKNKLQYMTFIHA